MPAVPRRRPPHLHRRRRPGLAASFESKVHSPAELDRWLAALPRPLVFTNGVFDLLHRGHVTYLARARALGAALLVALNTDASARRLGKGAGRPLNPLDDRMAVIAALASVDAVTWFDEDTPEALIAACRPEVLVGNSRVQKREAIRDENENKPSPWFHAANIKAIALTFKDIRHSPAV